MYTLNLILDGLLIGTNVLIGIYATYQLLEALFPDRNRHSPA